MNTTAAAAKKEQAEQAQKEKDNRANFERVVGLRVSNAIEKISLIGKAANPEAYKFDEKDVDKMEEALNNTVKETMAKMRKAASGEMVHAGKQVFQF